MIDALIQGRLHGQPKTRTGKNGAPFTTCIVRTATREQALFVSVIAFDDGAQRALQALGDKDAIALAGELTPKVWTHPTTGETRPSMDMVAHKVLTAYHVRKRQAAQDKPEANPRHDRDKRQAPRWDAWDAQH